jgi:hypothetical protein
MDSVVLQFVPWPRGIDQAAPVSDRDRDVLKDIREVLLMHECPNLLGTFWFICVFDREIAKCGAVSRVETPDR